MYRSYAALAITQIALMKPMKIYFESLKRAPSSSIVTH